MILIKYWTAIALALVLMVSVDAYGSSNSTKLLRYPDVHGNQIVFTYGGDLWLVSTKGGRASRLTNHPGYEKHAKFSPNGKFIAFTAQYGGDDQVFVVPREGGIPRQLTYYPATGPLPPRWGSDNQVLGWTPDGQSVVFRSARHGKNLSSAKFYTVTVDGGMPEALPVSKGGTGTISKDGKTLFYSPMMRDFRTWKRYQGGWAQDLYLFNLERKKAVNISQHPRTDRDPMWIGPDPYFVSDRDDFLNLYRYDFSKKKAIQLTFYKNADIKWASSDDERFIVYELMGALEIFDAETGKSSELKVEIIDDYDPARTIKVKVEKLIDGYDLHPNGKQIVFSGRGEILTIDLETKAIQNITQSAASFDREPSYSPDGKWIAYVSDKTGEEQIWLVDSLFKEAPRILSKNKSGRLKNLKWAPNGQGLAYLKNQTKVLVTTWEKGFDRIKTREIVSHHDEYNPVDFDWSPNSENIAYEVARQEDPIAAVCSKRAMTQIAIYSLKSGRSVRVTDPLYVSFNPRWSQDGQYLFFSSLRHYIPEIGTKEWNYLNTRNTLVYGIAVEGATSHPFKPSFKAEKDSFSNKSLKGGGSYEKGTFRLPIPPSDIKQLTVASNGIYYIDGKDYFYDEYPKSGKLFFLEYGKTQPTLLHDSIETFQLDQAQNHIFYKTGDKYYFQKLQNKIDTSHASQVNFADIQISTQLAGEWQNIFNDVWRRFRDFFYVKNMHGYDWQKEKEKYLKLLPFVRTRDDLNYILGDMIAELNASHTYISGGYEANQIYRHKVLLGAAFVINRQRYQIGKIFKGHNSEDKYRSPLTEFGVRASSGDYIIKVNGQDLKINKNIYQTLSNQPEGDITLTLSKNPQGSQSWQTRVTPISSEENLFYLQWVLDNHAYVTEKSEGRIGYIHLPNMATDGLHEFNKWFYPQSEKDALLIDVRYNGGGNVSEMILNRLSRRALAYNRSRMGKNFASYPATSAPPIQAALINGNSGSDGDLFPYAFRKAKLGKLIGETTWGGLIGTPDRGPLLDGGSASVAEYGFQDEDKWIIEGVGVKPDILVEISPEQAANGKDPQLDAGIELLLKELASRAPSQPQNIKDPVKVPKSD